MTPPGDRMRAIAARLCGQRTMERLVDPIVADLQAEYGNALQQGRVWRSRWIRIAGCVAFLKAVSLHACSKSMDTAAGWTDEDRRAFLRTIAFSCAAMIVVTLMLDALPLLNLNLLTHVSLARMALYLVPQALPIALPVGFAFGVLFGLRSRTISGRPTRAILVVAAICSVASFATLAWIMPEANQAFRELVFAQLAGHRRLFKGTYELSFSELSQQIGAFTTRQSVLPLCPLW